MEQVNSVLIISRPPLPSSVNCKHTSPLPQVFICTCRWVEGLKAANYVYQRMVEQEHAHQFYLDRNVKVSAGGWFKKWYLPQIPCVEPCSLDAISSEEWEDLSASPHASLWPHLSAGPTSPFGSSSGYQSDLSLSLCSSIIPPRQSLTVHSFNFSRPSTNTSSRKPSSLSATPCQPPPNRKQPAACSLPPTPGLVSAFSPTCPCHFRVMPSPKQPNSTPQFNKCCDECKISCQLALDL